MPKSETRNPKSDGCSAECDCSANHEKCDKFTLMLGHHRECAERGAERTDPPAAVARELNQCKNRCGIEEDQQNISISAGRPANEVWNGGDHKREEHRRRSTKKHPRN